MIKHLSQCQANGCHTAGMKQNSVVSSECLKIGVLQRNGGGQERKGVGAPRGGKPAAELKFDELSSFQYN